MAQVSDTWGLESYARKPNTLGPQPPTSSSYKRASKASGGGSTSPEPSSREATSGETAAQEKALNRGERLGGGRRGQGGRVGRRGQSRDGQRGGRSRRKGEWVQELGPESPSLAGRCKALLLIGLSGAYLAHLAAIQVGWQEKPVFQ